MNSMEEQYGFDAVFTSKVPDYLKCSVCHLVICKLCVYNTYLCFLRKKFKHWCNGKMNYSTILNQ